MTKPTDQETNEVASEENVSEETVEVTENEQTEDVSATDDVENETTELQAELEAAQEKIKEYWDQIVRLKAEIENNRKRAQRDVENAHKYAAKNFLESLLPILDSMEMGIAASEDENANIKSIKEGMEMTMSMFTQLMEKSGVKVIHPVGEKFNPDHHQAMQMHESDEHEPNTVTSVMQKGYMLNDRLIRPAMVMVSK